jgi:hypothetical protein
VSEAAASNFFEITFTWLPRLKIEKNPMPNFPIRLIPFASRPGNSYLSS